MTAREENDSRHEGAGFDPGPGAPAPVLRDYPPEAAPGPGDDTVPVEVPGEQVDPAHRSALFPEDEQAAGDRGTADVVPGTGEVVEGTGEAPD